MALKFDGTINAGALLQAGVLLVAAIGAVVWTQADIRSLNATQARIEASIAADIVSIRSDAAAREGRIRAAELALAGQASDLRAISLTLTRIEAQLEKLQPRP